MEQKSLIKAAKELVNVLGLQDEKTEKPIVIKSTMSQKDLDKFFKQAIEMIDPETDKISKDNQSVIDWYENPEEDEEPDEEVEEVEEEDEEDEEDEEPEESLEDQLKNAKKVADLKELLKNPAFNKVRKSLSAEKNPIKLKKAMRDALSGGSVEKPKSGNDKVKRASKTRIEVAAEVLKTQKPKTVKEWVELTNDEYGKANDKETMTQISRIQKVAPLFGVDCPVK